MTWKAVYEADTGRLVSVGTVIADPLPYGLAVADLGVEKPDWILWGWAPEKRAMVLKLPKSPKLGNP